MRSTIIQTTSYYQKHWENGTHVAHGNQVQGNQEQGSQVQGSPIIINGWQVKKGYFIVKRITDIVVASAVCLLVFPWLFPLLFILIRLDSKGPVIFRQQRVGFLEQVFCCYKFRTMYLNDTADTRQAVRNDPRVTRIGRFLRNTGLDELPQFINVLLGDMSIVGPRPHMLQDSREFAEVVADYNFRHLVRPGITGMSQVRGYRGPASTFQSIFRRYQWDVFYVRNISSLLDLKIILKTGILLLQSLFQRDKPLSGDNAHAAGRKQPSAGAIRKIA